MRSLEYTEMRTKIIDRLKEQKNVVLATCENGKVTARTVYCTSNELKIYFMTSKAYAKYKQIIKNTLVAMCFNNVQIQGRAVILGHPSSDENKEILERCEHLDKEFMYWAKYKNTVLIEVDITEVECWNNNGRKYIDVLNKKSYRIG